MKKRFCNYAAGAALFLLFLFSSAAARQGVADGLLNKQIAFNLGITEKTVISHRASLRRKLGMRTASEMTRFLMLVNGEVSGIEPKEGAH